MSASIERKRVGRPPLPPDERIARCKIVQKAWKGRNQEHLTAYQTAIAALPATKARKHELYAKKRQALIDSGVVFQPRGRPRINPLVRESTGHSCVHPPRAG